MRRATIYHDTTHCQAPTPAVRSAKRPQTFFLSPTSSSATPAASARPPAMGGRGTRSRVCTVASSGPTSRTLSDFVYREAAHQEDGQASDDEQQADNRRGSHCASPRWGWGGAHYRSAGCRVPVCPVRCRVPCAWCRRRATILVRPAARVPSSVVEHLPFKQAVLGSIPRGPTTPKFADCRLKAVGVSAFATSCGDLSTSGLVRPFGTWQSATSGPGHGFRTSERCKCVKQSACRKSRRL